MIEVRQFTLTNGSRALQVRVDWCCGRVKTTVDGAAWKAELTWKELVSLFNGADPGTIRPEARVLLKGARG